MGITSGEVAKGYDFCTCIDVNDLYFCVVCVAMPDVRVSIPKIFSPCHRIPGDSLTGMPLALCAVRPPS